MLAIDSNLIVRYLTGDHPIQSAKARTLIDGNKVFVSTTVLLEAQCVLRSVYLYTTVPLCTALRAFAGLPSVTLENAPLAAEALGWMENGMDFADALHLAKATECNRFITFDQRFIKAAKQQGIFRVRTP